MREMTSQYGRVIIVCAIGLILIGVLYAVLNSSFGGTVVTEVETIVVEEKGTAALHTKYKVESFFIDLGAGEPNYYKDPEVFYRQIRKSEDGVTFTEMGIGDASVKAYVAAPVWNEAYNRMDVDYVLIDNTGNYERYIKRGDVEIKYVIKDSFGTQTFIVKVKAD